MISIVYVIQFYFNRIFFKLTDNSILIIFEKETLFKKKSLDQVEAQEENI